MLDIRLYTFCCPRRTGLSHWGHYRLGEDPVAEDEGLLTDLSASSSSSDECERIGVAGGLLRLQRAFIPSLKGDLMVQQKVDVKTVCVEVDLA